MKLSEARKFLANALADGHMGGLVRETRYGAGGKARDIWGVSVEDRRTGKERIIWDADPDHRPTNILLRPTVEVAAELGITPIRVRQLATARGLGQRYGKNLLFSQPDIDAMRIRTPGRPRKLPA